MGFWFEFFVGEDLAVVFSDFGVVSNVEVEAH